MKRRAWLLCLLLPLASAVACQAHVGTNVSIPSDAAQQCSKHCETMGMRLTAVAVMANNVGCVCQFAAQAERPNAAGVLETPAAGMATIAAQQAAAAAAAAAQQQHLQQQQRQRRTW